MTHDKQVPRIPRPGDDALLALADRLMMVCDERDDARANLNAMTADRDFVIVQRDRARELLRALLPREGESWPSREAEAIRHARELLGIYE